MHAFGSQACIQQMKYLCDLPPRLRKGGGKRTSVLIGFFPPRYICEDGSSSTGNRVQDTFTLGLIAQTPQDATKLEGTNSDQSSCSLEATSNCWMTESWNQRLKVMFERQEGFTIRKAENISIRRGFSTTPSVPGNLECK